MLGASETLELLSGNQYTLAVNEGNEFEVIDHRNADDRRAAKTLSGGETFQASLALALALADQVGSMAAGGAAKLDSIFLDEGFGTLDADSLDAVASALETLGSDDRMVGIVTHVRELAERVPVRYEVVKGPRTSTITRSRRVKFSVDPWDVEYGTSASSTPSRRARWSSTSRCRRASGAPSMPVAAAARASSTVLFVDGVRRIDARVWIDGDSPGICASYAAGAVRCDGRAEVVDIAVARGMFSTAATAADIVTTARDLPGAHGRRRTTSPG